MYLDVPRTARHLYFQRVLSLSSEKRSLLNEIEWYSKYFERTDVYARKLAQLADTRRHMRRGCGTLTYRRNRKKNRKAPVMREVQITRHRQLFLVFLFSVSQFFFLQSSMFIVRDVSVEGQSTVKEKAIRKVMNVSQDSRFWEISPEAMQADILGIHGLESVDVNLHFPGQLKVQVAERKPVFTVASVSDPKNTFTVDKSGVVLAKGNIGKQSLQVLVDRTPKVGGRISADELEIATYLQGHLSKGLRDRLVSTSFDARDEVTLRVKYRDGSIPVRLGRGERLSYKLFLLEELVTSLKNEGAHVLSIDLRFSTPIVRKPFRPAKVEEAPAE